MPRFYLHLRRDGVDARIEDPDGDELADETLVRAHALQAASLMMRTRTYAIRDWMTCSFEITDAQGRHLMTVPFSDTVQDDAIGDATEF